MGDQAATFAVNDIRNSPLQLAILTRLCEGKAIQRQISQDLTAPEESISRIMRKLEKKGFAEIALHFIPETGNKSKIWKITSKGIEVALLASEPENFWKIAFQTYDTRHENFSIAPKIDKAFSKYENEILGITREYVIPFEFKINLGQLHAFSLKHPNVISNSWLVLLDRIGCGPPIIFQELEDDLKKHYPKLYKGFKGIDLSGYADCYKPLHKGRELENAIKNMRFHQLIEKNKTSKITKYRLAHAGFLLLLFHLFNELDENKKYGIMLKTLQEGLSDKKISRKEKLLKDRLPLLIKYNSKLLPGIFYYKDRLEINDYYILFNLVLIYFYFHTNFTNKISDYVILKKFQNQLENSIEAKLEEFHKAARIVLLELINNRQKSKSFVSDLSNEFFKEIKDKAKKRYAKYKRNWKKDTEKLQNSDDFWERRMAKNRDKEIPKWTFTGHEYVDELLSKVEWQIKFNDGIYQDKHDPFWNEILASKKDQTVLNRVANTILRKYLIIHEISKEHMRDYWGGQLVDKYWNYEKIIADKITFDFYLLYRFLEPEKWKKNFHKNETIKKWHNGKVKKLYQLGEKIFKEKLDSIELNS